MKTVRHKIDLPRPATVPAGRVDIARVDATTEADIARHIAEDEAQSRQDAALFAQRVRKRLGLSQAEFSARIHVSLDTIRNWEQGKRAPTGAAKALLRESDTAWEALRPSMRAEDEASFVALREGFRAGIPHASGEEGERAAARAFAILAAEGGEALVGRAREIAPGTFWHGGGGR